jgi:hypothetical protein
MLDEHHIRPRTQDEVCTAPRFVCGSDGDEAGLGAQQHREAGPRGGLGIDDGDARHGANLSSRCSTPSKGDVVVWIT